MPLDESEAVVNNTSETTVPDSGNSEPAAAASSESTNSEPVGASADAGGAEPSRTDDGSRSLKTDEAQPTQKTPDLAAYEKRLKDNQRAFQIERQKALEYERKLQALEQQLNQFQGVNPDDLRQFQQRHQVPLWSKKHPEHSKFQIWYQEASFINAKLGRISDPAKRQELAEMLWSDFDPEGQKVLAEYQNHLKRQQNELLADPDSYFEERFKKLFEPNISQWQQQTAQTYEQAIQAEKDVKEWFDKSPKEIWQGKSEVIGERLRKGEKWRDIQLELERDYYRAQASSAATARASAEEKERLLRGQAAGTVAHDPKTSSKVDPLKVAKERGIDPAVDMPAFVDLLQELTRTKQI